MAKIHRFGQATALPPEKMAALLTEMDQPYRLVGEIAYHTASRVGEVLRLQVADLQGDVIIFRAPNTKTKTTKTARVSRQLAAAIAAAPIPTTGYLFPGSGAGGHLTPRAMEKHVKRAADLIGVEGVSTHSFRRSMATTLHIGGMPLRAIQRITGHATLSALEKYLDIEGIEAARQQQVILDAIAI